MASMSDVGKGIRVSKSSVRLIMPKPLSGEEAEGLLEQSEGTESREVFQRAFEWTNR
jgi:hypothetical protein